MDTKTKNTIFELIKLYPTKRAALLPALWAVQEEHGWVPAEEIDEVAKLLEITPDEVHEIVSFYTMFSRKSTGKHHIQVCVGVCCKLKGADRIIGHLKERLNIDVDCTTDDGSFHLSTVECLGSCGTGPMMQIDNDYYENLDLTEIDVLLNRLKSK